MRHIVLFFLLFFGTNIAFAKTSKDHFTFIQKNLDRIVDEADRNVHIGVKVYSIKTGHCLYEKNADKLFVPASSLKLFTAGAALSILGPEYQFKTEFLTDGSLKGEVLEGNLFLRGAGDPSFALNDLEKMVRVLCMEKMTKINGEIVMDHFAYDDVSKGPGWMWDDIHGFSFAPMSALTINHSCLDIWVKPADTIALAPKVFSFPKTSFVSVKNYAITDELAERLSIERDLKTNNNIIEIKGEIGLKSGVKSFRVPLENPPLFTGSLLQYFLKKANIQAVESIKENRAPSSASTLTSHDSPSVSILLHPLLKNSDNLYADNLFKKVGQVYSKGQGNWKNGSQAVRTFLEKEVGLDVSEMVILDGSGLSRYNLVSPEHFVTYLTWVYNSFSFGPELLAALPIAGRDGCLKNRFGGNQLSIRAKSGTMTGITSLCGYVMTQDREILAVAILINGFVGPVEKYRKIEDNICLFLSGLSRY